MAYGCLPRMEALDRMDIAWVGLACDRLGRRNNCSTYQIQPLSQDRRYRLPLPCVIVSLAIPIQFKDG
jgi:hypothetical protein